MKEVHLLHLTVDKDEDGCTVRVPLSSKADAIELFERLIDMQSRATKERFVEYIKNTGFNNTAEMGTAAQTFAYSRLPLFETLDERTAWEEQKQKEKREKDNSSSKGQPIGKLLDMLGDLVNQSGKLQNKGDNLKKCSENYLREMGLNDAEIEEINGK